MSMFMSDEQRLAHMVEVEGMYRVGRGGLFAIDVGGKSRTKQEFIDDCDVNRIIDRFHKTGQLPAPRGTPSYMDVSAVPTLQEALQVMSDAEAAFARLPAKVRAEFQNDPMEFVKFASDKENEDRMREFGLLEPLPAPRVPVEVRVVNEPEGASEEAVKPSKGRKAD